jgi:nicotinamidase-related amidase
MSVSDMNGSAPDSCPVALLLIDVINDLDFASGDCLLRHALPVAERIAVLKQRAKALGIPVIYVNDNFGRWQADIDNLLEHCLAEGSRGAPMVRLLTPEPDEYVVLKPKHSGFYSTTLETLLRHLGARTLILTGLAGNICVFFTANDAFMRDFRLCVPADCIASNTSEENDFALGQMAKILEADITPSTEFDLDGVRREA